MKVELLDATTNPVAKIGRASAICYDARTDLDSNIRRAKHCKDKGHLTTLRFAYASFAIEEISRVCSHQLVRIAHAGILQESQRYVEQSDVKFVYPAAVAEIGGDFWARWMKLHDDAKELYAEAIRLGMKKQDARYCLPQSCHTKVNLCLNFQGWTDFLKNRTSKTAQDEIREVAFEIQRQLQLIAPEIFCD